MKLSELEIDKMSLPERGLWMQCETMKLEIERLKSDQPVYEIIKNQVIKTEGQFCVQRAEIDRLKAENASLWALAKFGRWCMNEHKADRISHTDDDPIWSKMLELKLYVEKIDGQKYWNESDLAQLPEKQEVEFNPLLALARFGRDCLNLYSGTGNIDGEKAYCSMMEHELFEVKLMTEPCGELCKCAYLHQYDFPLSCRQETAIAQLPEKRE